VIGGVLMQDGRPMAFEIKKLSEMERRWLIHEKKKWVLIHCFKTWGHYVGSKDVVVWTNSVILKYFTIQPKLSSKQVRWQDTLDLFNVDIQHKHGNNNVVKVNVPQKCDNMNYVYIFTYFHPLYNNHLPHKKGI
jgi:hypothetical protein